MQQQIDELMNRRSTASSMINQQAFGMATATPKISMQEEADKYTVVRNEVERLFRRLKGFRRIFSRFDKLDVVFRFFINFALIMDTLISVNRP